MSSRKFPFKIKYLILLSLVVVFTATFRPQKYIILKNLLSLCWIKEDNPNQKCNSLTNQLVQIAPSDALRLSTLFRYLSYAGQYEEIISLCGSNDTENLDFLSYFTILTSYKQLGYINNASEYVSLSKVPGEMIVSWSLNAYREEKKDESRIWLYLADAHGKDLNPAYWRWMGYLWWTIDADREKALEYLEPLLDEMPNAAYPRIILGKIYRSESIDKSIAMLEEAMRLDPKSSLAYGELIKSLTLRGSNKDLARLKVLKNIRIRIINRIFDSISDNKFGLKVRQDVTEVEE